MPGALAQPTKFQITKLAPEEEAKFRAWATALPWYSQFVQKYGEPPNLDDPQYDYRGAFKAGITPSPYEYDGGAYHWPSSLPNGQMLKAPDHPTAWMETFMRATGKDPNALGFRDPVSAQQYLQRMRIGGSLPALAPPMPVPLMPPALAR